MASQFTHKSRTYSWEGDLDDVTTVITITDPDGLNDRVGLGQLISMTNGEATEMFAEYGFDV
jgi:hypothetical protein